MFIELKSLVEQREDAISQAKLNCKKFKTFMTYGVDSFVDRLPSFSTSVLKCPEGFSVSSDNKYLSALTDEYFDKLFIEKMCFIFSQLNEPYKEIFVEHFIHNKQLKEFHMSGIYKILERGYLKIALMDADIPYTHKEEMKYQLELKQHDSNTKNIIKEMKARLKLLRSWQVSGYVFLTRTDENYLSIENKKMIGNEFFSIENLVNWINQLNTLNSKSGLSPKDAVIKFIFDIEWKYLDTTDRNNLLKGLLALACLDDDVNYTPEEFEYDAMRNCRSQSFINEIKKFQFSLKV